MPSKFQTWLNQRLKKIVSLFRKYNNLLHSNSDCIYKGEFDNWKTICMNMENPPTSILDSIAMTSDFLNINILLRLFATLPLTAASAERVFSSLARVQTAYPSTMEQERLQSLLLMHVHREIPLTHDEVIDHFSSSSTRRLQFML